MKHAVWLLAFAAGTLPGATLKGTVVEQQTGKALARALVVVRPVAGTNGATQSIHTDTNGAFEFPSIAAGSYIVIASRPAFAPVEYGQKRWKAAGVPVAVEEDREVVLHIALPRFGAITGRIVDENDVGLSEHDVVAYRTTHPPQLVAKAQTDDRGVFRIAELEPGSYYVRTAPKQYDDEAYLPTFYRDSATVEDARPVEVAIDRDTVDIVVHPTPGRLFSVSGRVNIPRYPPVAAQVTLSSDMGSQGQSTDSEGAFHFSPVAPGKYELFAIVPGARNQPPQAAFQQVEVDRDRGDLFLRLGPLSAVHFVFEDTRGAAVDSSGIQVISKRLELWGDGKPEYLSLADNAATMLPGRWSFTLAPNSAWYVANCDAPAVIPPGESTVKFVLSTAPASLRGTVSGASAAAPVFLEHDGVVRTVRADVNGRFQFTGLAPGVYHLLSTFDFQEADAATILAADPIEVKLEQGAAIAQDLVLR